MVAGVAQTPQVPEKPAQRTPTGPVVSGTGLAQRLGMARSDHSGQHFHLGASAVLLSGLCLAAGCQSVAPSQRLAGVAGSGAINHQNQGSQAVFASDRVQATFADAQMDASPEATRRDAALALAHYPAYLTDDGWLQEARPSLDRPIRLYLNRSDTTTFIFFRPDGGQYAPSGSYTGVPSGQLFPRVR